MRKMIDLLLIPSVIFVMIVLAVVIFKIFETALHVVDITIRSLIDYFISGFADDVLSLFDGPLRILAFLITIGLLILLIMIVQESGSGSRDDFLRGRRLGSRRSQSPRRSTERPSSQPAERRSPTAPSTRPNRRSY